MNHSKRLSHCLSRFSFLSTCSTCGAIKRLQPRTRRFSQKIPKFPPLPRLEQKREQRPVHFVPSHEPLQGHPSLQTDTSSHGSRRRLSASSAGREARLHFPQRQPPSTSTCLRIDLSTTTTTSLASPPPQSSWRWNRIEPNGIVKSRSPLEQQSQLLFRITTERFSRSGSQNYPPWTKPTSTLGFVEWSTPSRDASSRSQRTNLRS